MYLHAVYKDSIYEYYCSWQYNPVVCWAHNIASASIFFPPKPHWKILQNPRQQCWRQPEAVQGLWGSTCRRPRLLLPQLRRKTLSDRCPSAERKKLGLVARRLTIRIGRGPSRISVKAAYLQVHLKFFPPVSRLSCCSTLQLKGSQNGFDSYIQHVELHLDT